MGSVTEHTDRLLDEVKFLSSQFEEDPQNKAFGDAVQKLFLDLGQDENGKPTFKPHLIKDLTDVIIPAIFENTRYVPIPRIEVSDPMIDAVVENLVIETDNLFPNTFEFGSDNYFRMGRKGVTSKKDNKIMIAGSGIQMDLRDVAYYVRKKQGFPSVTDKGVMDIFLGGEGFSFKIAARNAQPKDRTHFVVIDKVDVLIKNLNIKVKQSNHKLLFKIAKPLLLKVMRPVIQKVIEKQIRDNFEKADAFAYKIHQDAMRAKEAAPIPISTWPLPRKIPCSRTSPCQVVSQPRPPSTSSLLPRVTDGNLLSSASAVPVLLQTFLNCDKSLASHMVPPGLRFKAATTPTVPPACHLALLVQPALIMAVAVLVMAAVASAVLVDKVLVFRRALASVTRLTKLSIPREMLPVVVVI